MRLETSKSRPANWWIVIFGDIQFWIPLVVLLAGLLVLRWIS